MAAPTNPGLAKDLGKRSSDLLTKEFPSDYKLEWKGKGASTPHGTVATETTLTQKGEKVIGAFKSTFKGVARNADVEVKVDTDRALSVELSVQDELVKNLKTKVAAESSKGDNFGTFTIEYKHPQATVTASADYGKADGSLVKASVLVGQPTGLVLGSQLDYVAGRTNRLAAFSVTGGYRSADFDLLAFDRMTDSQKDQKNEVGASYFHQTSPDFAIASEFSLDTLHLSEKPKLVIGSQWKANADTTVKTTFNTAGQLSFSYQQKLSPRITATFGAALNAGNFSKATTTFGGSLSLAD